MATEIVETPLEKSTGVTNPLVLVQSMIERGADPEAMKKMMDLAERWQANQARAAFALAMKECQAEMPRILKAKDNQHTRSKYADLGVLVAEITPIYTSHGFSVSFTTAPSPPPLENMVRVTAIVRHEMGHIEEHSIDLPRDGVGPKGGASAMNPLQGCGSTTSYGRRYLHLLIWNLSLANEDDDGVGGGSQKITSDQVQSLKDLLDACAKAGHPVDMGKFLNWLLKGDKGHLEDITNAGYAAAVPWLIIRAKGKKAAP